ncbi:hypothetical protein CU098_011140 [Rhizopus stolonifer]|uniref:Uncharacterized protein n=1 Tax=Rhizopus stolonifer TaxID=4846 RepID=A0A367KJV6_RHIST|nr:hypothetical protein CU098_011140 [Rhizopus stolonifer]
MVYALQMETNNPSLKPVMFFFDSIYKTSLSKDGVFRLIFEAIDVLAKPYRPKKNKALTPLSAINCMTLSLSAVCNHWEDGIELTFFDNAYAKKFSPTLSQS